MLEITIPAREFWDEKKEEFVNTNERTLRLEHSLVSLSKWEKRWHKSFLGTLEKTDEESIDYIKCMTLTQNVPSEVYDYIPKEVTDKIRDYINDPMTATRFSEDKRGKKSNEIITAELIYYWMISFSIPQEFSKWHLNSLLALIRVCEVKNQPAKKMSKNEVMRRNAALNAARRKRLNSKG